MNRDGPIKIFIPNLGYSIPFQQALLKGRRALLVRTAVTGLSEALGRYGGWGALRFDYDNGGWLDLVVLHGNAHREYVREYRLMRNKEDSTCGDVPDRSGRPIRQEHVGRGAAWADVDDDGDIDLLVVNVSRRRADTTPLGAPRAERQPLGSRVPRCDRSAPSGCSRHGKRASS